MKKLLVIALLMVMVSGLAFAQGAGTPAANKGDLTVMFYSPRVDIGGGSDTSPGYLLRANFKVADAFKLNLEYTTNQHNFGTTIGDLKFNDTKIGAKWLPYHTDAGNIGIGIFTQSTKVDFNGTDSFSGLGYGIDGDYKAGEKVTLYGLLDYNSSLKGEGLTLKSTTFEVGGKYDLGNNIYGSLGYRSNNISGDATVNFRGFVVGLGMKF